MKVSFVLIFAVSYVSARGSGPYLPSGWRPSGPAFYLPSEVTKPSETPNEETQLPETEASGSDAFREYGPPKLEEISIKQNLPEVATEQTFFVKVNSAETVTTGKEAVNIEANTKLSSVDIEEGSTVTESQVAEEVQAVEEQVTESTETQTTIGAVILDVVEHLAEVEEVQSEELKLQENIVDSTTVAIKDEIVVPTATLEEIDVPLSQQELVQDSLATIANEEANVASTEKVQDAVIATDTSVLEETDVSNIEVEQDAAPVLTLEVIEDKVPNGENSIAETIGHLENKDAEAVVVREVTSNQETSGALEQVPEGFEDNNPPGFAVYGPPSQEDLSRLAAAETVISDSFLDNNEVRRRRFSPKLRSRNH